MADREDSIVQMLGQRIWPQAEGVLSNLWMFVDRTADRMGADEDERIMAVDTFLGQDLADMYRDWIDESDE